VRKFAAKKIAVLGDPRLVLKPLTNGTQEVINTLVRADHRRGTVYLNKCGEHLQRQRIHNRALQLPASSKILCSAVRTVKNAPDAACLAGLDELSEN